MNTAKQSFHSIKNYEGIDFYNLKVNNILLKNIIALLVNKSTSFSTYMLSNGMKIHKISRAGYRLLELTKDVNTHEAFSEFIFSKQAQLLAKKDYLYCGHFEYEGKFYIIISYEKNESFASNFWKIRLWTLDRIDSIINKHTDVWVKKSK